MYFLHRRALALIAALAFTGPAVAGPPLTLADALREAYSLAPVAEATGADIAAEQARLRQAGLRPNPDISIDVEDFAGNHAFSGFDRAQITGTLGLPLELGGKRGARTAFGSAAVRTATESRRALLADLARDVRSRFAVALSADQLLKLAQGELATAQEIERVVGLLVDGGREPPLRAVTATVEREKAEIGVSEAEAVRRSAYAALAATIGRSSPDFTVAKTGLVVEGATPADNPDLALADARVASAEARLRVERANRVPDPRLGVGVRSFRGDGATALVASIGIPFPLFNRNGGAVAAAAADLRAGEARRREAQLQLMARTEGAEAAVVAAERRVEGLMTKVVPGAREALRIARLGYSAGRFPYLELLQAQRALAEAERAAVTAGRDLLIAVAERDRALGRIPNSETN